MLDGHGRPPHDQDVEAFFCCCEFVDQHGERRHLADASALDSAVRHRRAPLCSPEGLAALLSDLDDRVRLPMHGGAVYLGFLGAAPLVAVPLLFRLAISRFSRLLAVAVVAPAGLGLCARCRRTLGGRFFQATCGTSLGYAFGAFTLVLGEHLHFGGWLLTAVGFAFAALQAHVAAHAPPPPGLAKLESSDDEAASDACQRESQRERLPLRGGPARGPQVMAREGGGGQAAGQSWPRIDWRRCRDAGGGRGGGHHFRGSLHVVWLDVDATSANRTPLLLASASLAAAAAALCALALRRACELRGGPVGRMLRVAAEADESSLELALAAFGAAAAAQAAVTWVWLY